MNGCGKTIKYNCVRGPPSQEELNSVQDQYKGTKKLIIL